MCQGGMTTIGKGFPFGFIQTGPTPEKKCKGGVNEDGLNG